MMLIVESGATKADWCLCRSGKDGNPDVRKFRTGGINVSTMDSCLVTGTIADFAGQIGLEEAVQVKHVHFYVAGLVSGDSAELLRQSLKMHFPEVSDIEIASDMLAAARALFADGEGVAAIMGTGSNSCFYDGRSVVRCIRSGGFVLGDEGSGAALGRMFLSDYFKELVPEPLAAEFRKSFPEVDYVSAVRNIYKGETPSGYLASFAPFVTSFRDIPYVASLVTSNVRNFVERSLSRYGCSRVGVAGSFGLACRAELEAAGAEYGLEFVDFMSSPLQALVSYHLAAYE